MDQTFSRGERRLRGFFRRLNPLMLALWRLGDGRFLNSWPSVGGRIMVIHHIGRRTGSRLRTPVNYAEHDASVYCLAGLGRRADWFKNLQATPRVEVWLPGTRWQGVAEDATGDPDAGPRLRQVLIASGFAAYAAGLNPRRMTQEAVEALLEEYRLVRIRPIEA